MIFLTWKNAGASCFSCFWKHVADNRVDWLWEPGWVRWSRGGRPLHLEVKSWHQFPDTHSRSEACGFGNARSLAAVQGLYTQKSQGIQRPKQGWQGGGVLVLVAFSKTMISLSSGRQLAVGVGHSDRQEPMLIIGAAIPTWLQFINK